MNPNLQQMEYLVLYGLDMSDMESGRHLAHFFARSKRLKTVRVQECNLSGKALFAIVTSLRKSHSIRSLEKLMLSMNNFDTQDSIVTLCGLVKEAAKLRSLCTFYTGVIILWPGGSSSSEWISAQIEDTTGNEIIALCEKKSEVLHRLQL